MLVVCGSSRLLQIGQSGGFLGHVLVALSPMEPVVRRSNEAATLRSIGVDPENVWRIMTIECTRSQAGLHKSALFVRLEHGRVMLVAEVQPGSGTVGIFDVEDYLDVWQSPREFRGSLNQSIVHQVVAEMGQLDCNWSFFTAARALLSSSHLSSTDDDDELLEEIQAGWSCSPICTTIPIAFWQRYLCKLAAATGQSAATLVKRWMPIRADAVLPGALVSAMLGCGWVKA